MPWPLCDVCGGPAKLVASSGMGAVSFAYCTVCAQSGAEPFGVLAAWVGLAGVDAATADEATLATVRATCTRVDRLEPEFWAAAAASREEMEREFTSPLTE